MGDRLTDIFLQLFCEKNSDGTKNLRLKGKDMQQRIGTRLVDEDMHKVAEFLLDHPEVVKLDLCYNDIGDEGAVILAEEYFSEENNLEHLNLICCDIGWVGMEKLCSAADTMKLKTLRVNGNPLGVEGGKFVAMILGASQTLKHLDVAETDQTVGGIQYFLSMIRDDIGTNSTLKVLDISRILPQAPLYQYDPMDLAHTVGVMLKVNTVLVELHLQKCEFRGHEIEELLLGLQRNKTLLLLDLGYNQFGDHGMELIGEWLNTGPNLLGLNVAGNNITNIGARAIGLGMPFSKIRMLDISYNKMTDRGLIAVLHSIKKPYMLRMFYLWGNKIGDRTNTTIDRMLSSGVLEQENIDVKLYTVDGKLCPAFYPSDHYKHKYYCVMDYGVPIELRIKRNKVYSEYAQPRALVNFQFYERYPAIDENLPEIEKPC